METLIGFVTGMFATVGISYLVIKLKPQFVLDKLIQFINKQFKEEQANEVTNRLGWWFINAGTYLLAVHQDQTDVEQTVLKLIRDKEELRRLLKIPYEE